MAVGDFAHEFQLRAAGKGIGLVAQVPKPWLSGLGHLDRVVQDAPSEVLDRLATACLTLGGSPDAGLRRRKPLMVDFVLGDNVIVELDEFQHFTSARYQTLDFYEGV